MKFNEELLEKFDLKLQKQPQPVTVMRIGEMLEFLKACAERIVKKSKIFRQTKDVDTQMDCMDIVTAKLNDFVQVFKDLMIFLRKEEGTYRGGTSLRYSIISYDTFEFPVTEASELFLKELLLRNEITHDYFNRELHQQKLVWIMENCTEGALDVYDNLYRYCIEHHLLNRYDTGQGGRREDAGN